MRLRVIGVPLATPSAVRVFSEARSNYDGTSASPWPSPGETPTYPSALSDTPFTKPRMRRTHIEWRYFHGHGGRLGRFGPTREVADFEYADGTPSSVGPRRFAYKHHQDHLLVQLIRAGAAVERAASQSLLPRVPGTPEQRAWDPSIPLFLEDVDERGRAPPPGAPKDAHRRAIDEKMAAGGGRRHGGEELEANSMFEPIDTTAFVSDQVEMKEEKRPYWSRRRWALTDRFLVPKSPKPKNTIKDE